MSETDRVRAFSRRYARRAGLLEQSGAGTGLSPTETRILNDLGDRTDLTARSLAAGLGLDEGYLSRVLRRLEADGWLRRARDPADARRRVLRLTPSGEARLAPLRAAAGAEIARWLEPLGPEARADLLAAMDRIEALLPGPDPTPQPLARLRDLRPGDAGWIVQRHGALYAADEGFDASFEALVARILADFIDDRDPSCERGWIAETAEGRRLGCIFCVRLDATTARLRLFLVEPCARGTGLGRLLLDTCLAHARRCGFARLRLWTHESHRAACALYAKTGFAMTGSVPVRAFGRDLVEQTWEIDLSPHRSPAISGHRDIALDAQPR